MRRLTPVLVGGLLAAMPATAAAAPERVFELATPGAKGGSDVMSGAFATSDGNAVSFDSYAALGDPDQALFASTYVSRRTADGWVPTSMQAKVLSENPTLLDGMETVGLSADLSSVFSKGYAAWTAGDQNDGVDVARVRNGATEWVTRSRTLPDRNMYVDSMVAGASADGRHFIVTSSKPMLAGIPGGRTELYLYGPNGRELASALPNGDASGGAKLGNGRGFQQDNRAISADGQTLFFTTTTGVAQLYVRRDGETTLVSADIDGDPGTAPSVYQAASEDGSRVLFSSTSQLTEDAPVGGGLYRYDVEAGELRLMVAGSIAGVMQESDDLSVVYLASTAQLVPGTGTVGQPNVYRVTEGGARFVATISPQDSFTWSWGQGANVGGASSDGKRFVFQSRIALAGANLGLHKSGVYRYDADADALKCISCHPDGSIAANGASVTSADLGMNVVPGVNPTRATTADGRLAVFETADALLPEDQNTLADVYGYDDDGLHLISGGRPNGESHVIDVTPDGSDVFFVSTARLAADDLDQGYRDVYTARIGGGFPAIETPCTADMCERPDAPATVFNPVIGSTGIFDQPVEQAEKTTFKVGSISAASRRSWARSGRTTLQVRVSTGAKITVTTKRAGKTIAKTSASRQSAGTATLKLQLSKSAAAQLKRTGRLKLTVTVAVSGAAKATKATVTLVAPKTKKAGR